MKTFCKVASVALGAALLSSYALSGTAAEEKGKAPTVSREVSKPLKAAQEDIKEKKYHEAIDELKKVEAFQKRTPYDTHVMNEFYRYSYSKLGDKAAADRVAEQELNDGFLSPQESQGLVKSLAVDDFNSKRYDDAIHMADRAIKGGYGDDIMKTVLAQAYYQKGDYNASLKVVQPWVDGEIKAGETPKEQQLILILANCDKLGASCSSHAYELLVQYYPKPEYWQNLLSSMYNQKGANDRTLLDLDRLAFAVGAMHMASQYQEMAELAMESGTPGEAQQVLEKGLAQNVFTDQRERDRAQRLLETAKKRSAQDQAGLPKLAADAARAKTGDADVALGIAYWSYKQYAQAVQAFNDGLAKGSVKNEAHARLMLGIAQLGAGNRADAIKAFRSVKGDPMLERLAHMWSLYARQGQG